MVAPAIAAAGIMAGGSLLGGLLGGSKGKKDAKRLAKEQERATKLQESIWRDTMQRLDRIPLPDLEALNLVFEEFQQAGLLTPEMLQEILTNPSAYLDIQEDVQAVEAQRATLSKLDDIIADEGMDSQLRAQLFAIRGEEEQRAKSARDALMNQALATGTFGSGLDWVMRQQANQAAAGRAAQRGIDAAALAEQRAMEALIQRGTLGGQMRGQQAQEEQAKAAAIDALERFNVANRLDVQAQNVAAANAAQEYNLRRQQEVADVNVQLRNQALAENLARRNAVAQQMFENEMAKAGQATQAGQAYASGVSSLVGSMRPTPATPSLASQMLQVGGTVLGGMAQAGAFGGTGAGGNQEATIQAQPAGGMTPEQTEYQRFLRSGVAYSDENLKTDVEDISPEALDSLLSELSGVSYRYDWDDPDQPPRAGVVAQDVENANLGQEIVQEGPMGKQVALDDSQLLALLGRLNEKIEEQR